MALSKEQVAAFRAEAETHNKEVGQRLAPAVEQLVEALSKAILVGDELIVADVDDWLRVRDTLMAAGAGLKANLDQVVRPLLAKLAPPAA